METVDNIHTMRQSERLTALSHSPAFLLCFAHCILVILDVMCSLQCRYADCEDWNLVKIYFLKTVLLTKRSFHLDNDHTL